MNWPAGIVFPAPSDDHVGRLSAAGKCYEFNLLQDLASRIPRGALVVDVGAHMGVHTTWLAAICGCCVVALEPRPDMFEKLRANVEANGLEVTLIQAAAGREAGRGTMDDMVLTVSVDGSIPIITVDSLDLADVAAIKIDVEGFEMEVLEGARETIKAFRPILYVEGELHRLDIWMNAINYKRFGRFAVTPVYGYEPI